MTQYLPPYLLSLFAPRPPLEYIPPKPLPHETNKPQFGLLSEYKSRFEDPKDTPVRAKVERVRDRKKREKREINIYKVEQAIAVWDPNNNEAATSDPYRTLFVARLNYDTSEAKLRREFETYGPIKKITQINDTTTSKPRGYAFIEFKHQKDMHEAYKRADGKRIDGKRVLVDVERGRTQKGWLPRRLGGGLGGRKEKAPE